MNNSKKLYSILVIGLFVVLSILAVLGSRIGMLGLGIFLVIFSGWWFTRAKYIWLDYQKMYKKTPKNQRSIWNRPSQFAYSISMYIFMPLGLAFGSLFIYLAWYIRS